MTDPTRIPGSREEDAWLSDEQLKRCAPAEQDTFQAAVPTRMVSNGEYMPHPQTPQQKQVEARVQDIADRAAKKLGISRREFLAGSGAIAASCMAMNEVYGKTFFHASHEELYEPEAAAHYGPPRNLFVFDDQTHIVRSSSASPRGLRALAQGPGVASAAAGFTANPYNGLGGNPAGVDELGNPWSPWNPGELAPDFPPNPGAPTTVEGEFFLGQYINRMYLQSQVAVSIISNANFGLFTAPGETVPRVARNITEGLLAQILTGWQTAQCRDYINHLAGTTRALAHGQIYPGYGNTVDPAFGDYTQWQIENMEPDSWKGYNVAQAASTEPGTEFTRWRLDDEVIAYPTYEIIARNKRMLKKHPGFFNMCIHKGLSANATQPGGANNTPQFGNPDDMVKVATDWPEFNWIIYHACFRPAFWDLQALIDIENRPGAMQPTLLRDSDGHEVPNIRWATQLAQIAAGKYVAGAEPTSTSPSSRRRLRNIYAELGTTMASMIVTFPTVWAHLIGQLLHYMGPNHIVWGSDSLWYGGPQWQIEMFWRTRIPDDMREKWGYPQLTEDAKRKILGGNSARLYDMPGRTRRYRDGNLPGYAADAPVQPGGYMDQVLRGPGYPEPIIPAYPRGRRGDRFSQLKQWMDDLKVGRSNERHGWMRIDS